MSGQIWKPGRGSRLGTCFGLTSILLALGLGLLACRQEGSGGGSSPSLSKIVGPTVLGPGGKTELSVYGYGTGPISWSLLPTGLGDFVVDKPGTVSQPTSPPIPNFSKGFFHAGSSEGTCDLIATAGAGGASYRSDVTLRVVQGIAIQYSQSPVNVTPGLNKQISAQVFQAAYPFESISQNVTWVPEGNFADGKILPSQPGTLVINAPSVPGTYAIKGTAEADPLATALIRVIVQ